MNLTELKSIEYLLSNETNSGEKMKGTIRVKENCPKCKKPFQHFNQIGYLCPECKTVPKKFYIDLFWKGERIRLFSDKQGQTLDTYKRAQNLHEHINYEIKNHAFDPTKYLKAELTKFWCVTLLDEMFKDRIDNIAPTYKNNYTRMCKVGKDYFGTKDIREIENYDIINYERHLKDIGYTYPNTRKKYLSHFHSFINYCIIDRNIPGVSMPAFPETETIEPTIHWLNAEDQQAIFNDFVSDENKPIIALMMIYGLRPGEARALKCKDVDFKNNSITIHASFSKNIYRSRRKGKHAKSLILPIHPELNEYIEKRINNNHPEAWLYPNPKTGNPYGQNALGKLWKKIRSSIGLPEEFKLYGATRHSRASQAATNGTNSITIKNILGHANIKTTEKYMHFDLKTLQITLEKFTLKKGDRHQTVTEGTFGNFKANDIK
jgi:integrase